MTRLLIHVEGETEEAFVNELLGPHLRGTGWGAVSARLLGNARLRERRGGIKPWPAARADITRHLRGDPGCYATTMVDFYRLPQSGDGAWPGRAAANRLALPEKPRFVERECAADLREFMGPDFNPGRFVPFVVLHEFEALLFSDCEAFSRGVERPGLRGPLQTIRDAFDNPEEINDSPLTAPSKRLEALIPGYQKPLFGTLAALEIGLDRIREECPHFGAWVAHLEKLGA